MLNTQHNTPPGEKLTKESACKVLTAPESSGEDIRAALCVLSQSPEALTPYAMGMTRALKLALYGDPATQPPTPPRTDSSGRNILHHLMTQASSAKSYARYLIEIPNILSWYPAGLLMPDQHGNLPLHLSANELRTSGGAAGQTSFIMFSSLVQAYRNYLGPELFKEWCVVPNAEGQNLVHLIVTPKEEFKLEAQHLKRVINLLGEDLWDQMEAQADNQQRLPIQLAQEHANPIAKAMIRRNAGVADWDSENGRSSPTSFDSFHSHSPDRSDEEDLFPKRQVSSVQERFDTHGTMRPPRKPKADTGAREEFAAAMQQQEINLAALERLKMAGDRTQQKLTEYIQQRTGFFGKDQRAPQRKRLNVALQDEISDTTQKLLDPGPFSDTQTRFDAVTHLLFVVSQQIEATRRAYEDEHSPGIIAKLCYALLNLLTCCLCTVNSENHSQSKYVQALESIQSDLNESLAPFRK